MDGNNWRAAQGQVRIPGQVMGGEAAAAAAGGMEGGDWRTQLQSESRQKIIKKIMVTLKRHLHFSGEEGLQDLKRIAVRFEEKFYTAATSQSDYLRKISLKLLALETKSQNPMANTLQSNAASNNTNPQDPASQSMQHQMQNQDQPLPMPMVSNQSQVWQQLLSQNMQNNILSTGVPNSADLTSALAPVGGMSQGTLPNGPVQNPNMQNIQNMSNVGPNAVGNPMGQGVPSNMYANSQKQIQGRQQQVVPQDQQQQSQNTEYLFNEQLQQHLMKQKFQQQQQQQHQQVGLQQQANALPRDMQQRIQTSSPMLQQQTAIHQKQLLQPQRVIPDVPLTSSDSTSQTGNASNGDWQEDIYQKIKSMHEMYYPDLNEMYQRMAAKLQQHDALPQQPKNGQLNKLRIVKAMLERLIIFLRTNKNDIQPHHKEKIVGVEKQIANMLNSNRPRKPVSSMQQGQLTQPHMHPMQQSQQRQPQISQMHTNEGQMNSQMQPMNAQGSTVTTQQNNLTNMQHNPLSSVSNVSNPHQSMMDALQPGSNVDPGQGNALNQMQQVAMGSLQQNPVSGSQQMNINSMSLSSHNGLTTIQSNGNPSQSNSNTLQPQQIKQEQQMFSTQQIKQQYQRLQMQQQYMHRQQLMQQQQQQQTTAQQQAGQLSAQQMMQLNQMNEANVVSGKSGVLQQHNTSGERPSYHHQQMKPGTPFSISSQQVLQVTSPQIGHHPSPQIDQLNLLTPHTKVGTPLHSATSPFVAPSPSTSMALSPMPGSSEKINSDVSSSSNAGNSIHHPTTTAASVPNQSLAIGTPGISASPLLAEFTSPDVTHGVVSTIVSGPSNVVDQPLERLIKVVKSMSPKALSASVSDSSSVVSMFDRIAGSAPGNGSRAAVGEDLVALTKYRLQARNFFPQDGPSGTKKMRRYTKAMPSNIVSSTGSVNDSFRHLNGNESDGESTGASIIKRPRIEANHALEEERREINQRLIDTVVYISDDDVDPTAVVAAAEGGEGTIVKCCFSAVALSPNLKSQYASAQMSPIQPLRLLIPNNYPNCSPILLDKFPVEVSKEYEDLSIKARSRFSISLRTLAQPISLGEIARTWDDCARAVISEYAQQSGGGTFSSKYGTWENCLTAT